MATGAGIGFEQLYDGCDQEEARWLWIPDSNHRHPANALDAVKVLTRRPSIALFVADQIPP
jgi:hypothetical protein